ncbi:sugar transferase [Carnobacterium maltaromaticum]|uniref:sugar transferase n=1 Tax=Carnobacterium maltaromaticum TaxID=2751 RepID=UPI00295EC6BF|nr:sugar transferase [Carnobacterium maltaromaticum]
MVKQNNKIKFIITNNELRSKNPLFYKGKNRKLFFFSKTIVDKFLAGIGLCILSPWLIIVAFILKITEPGSPVFFKQVRIGKNSEKFEIYKFRTMHVGAEGKLDQLIQHNEIEGAMFKMKDDPRITRFGKVLRNTSIDEFPQLFNVLKGDMALVGPRPPLPREVEMYSNYDMQRLAIVPGCTGLWQISGRNELSFKEMVDLDLEYINTMSLWLDFNIVFKTIFMLMRSRNGY